MADQDLKIAIGSDHRGFELKEKIKSWLCEQGFDVVDFGPASAESCDYPDFAIPLGEAVGRGEVRFGILICYTGIGMTIASAKAKGARPALCRSPEDARMARAHNDANILVLAARDQELNSFQKLWREWIETRFEGGRHQRRVEKIIRYEDRISCR